MVKTSHALIKPLFLGGGEVRGPAGRLTSHNFIPKKKKWSGEKGAFFKKFGKVNRRALRNVQDNLGGPPFPVANEGCEKRIRLVVAIIGKGGYPKI